MEVVTDRSLERMRSDVKTSLGSDFSLSAILLGWGIDPRSDRAVSDCGGNAS